MSIKIKLGKMASIVASLLAVFVIVAAPQMASAAQSDCPATAKVCLWEHSNYSGIRVDYFSAPVGYCWNVTASLNNKVTGLWNKTGHTLAIFDETGCTGAVKTFNNGQAVNNLGGVPIFFNDRMSSFQAW